MRNLLLLLLFLSTINLSAQVDNTYSKFLIIKTQAIDYYPVWGNNDNEIYINLLSKDWRKYDLSKCNYIEGSYYSHNLAINTAENWTKITNQETIKRLETDKNWKPREIKDKKGNVFTLEESNFNTILYIQEASETKKTIINIKGNAHSLSISPTGKYLACLFELSGLIIFDIEKEKIALKESNNQLKSISNLEKAELAFKNRDLKLLEKVILNCTSEEKETTSYNYYFGFIMYLKSEDDSTLIPEAIIHLNKSQDDFRFQDSNILLSYLYQNNNDMENSLKFAEKAIEKLPEHPSGYRLKADYYFSKGNQEKACEFYKHAFDKGDEMAELNLIDCKK